MANYPPLFGSGDGQPVYQPDDGGTQYLQADGTVATMYRPVRKPSVAAASAPPALSRPGMPAAQSMAQVYEQFVGNPALPAGPASAPAPPSLFSRASTAMAGVASAAGGAAKQLGTSIKNDPMGAVNVALSVAGALQYATAKAPKLPGRPDTYAPVIRPAQGLNPGSLETGRGVIQAAQRQASRPTGADTGTSAVVRLLAQQQAGEQQNQLTLKDSEAFQQDQRRVDEQTNQAYDANYKTQRSYEEKKFDIGQRAFESRRQQSAGMAQAAMTYLTQQQTAKRQSEQLRLESKNRQQESQIGVLAGRLAGVSDVAEQKRLVNEIVRRDPTLIDTYKASYPAAFLQAGGELPTINSAPSLFAKGGKASSGQRNIKPLPSSVETTHQMSKEHLQNQMRITQQAMRAFQQTLQQASQRRGKGIRGT